MDRKPLPPPFPVGTRLRYAGTREASVQAADGSWVPYIAPGLCVTINRVKAGRRGTLAPIPMDDVWDDDGGEPVLDTTRDGYSAYDVEVPGRQPFGRIIWPADAHEWVEVRGS